MTGPKEYMEIWRRRSYVQDIDSSLVGRDVALCGWVHRKRVHGGVLFIILRDATGTIQLSIHKDKVKKGAYKKAQEVTLESSISVEGEVVADKRAPRGVEVSLSDLKIVHLAEPWPIKKDTGKTFLLDHRHLHLRSPRLQAIMLVRAAVLRASREYLDNEGFTEVHPPMFISVAVEGGATLFPIDYFGRKAYLTQSGQLYLEAAINSMGKVYTVNPSFRAEKSRTRRHLTEFWEIECEVPFATHDDIMRVEEELLSYICSYVLKRYKGELKLLRRELRPPESPFERITYAEGLEIARKAGVGAEPGEEFGAGAEKAISSHFSQPFFIVGFPTESRSFYHQPDPQNPEVTLSSDLMAPDGYGELSSGGQRISDYDLLVERIKEQNLPLENYKWYLDLRRYGIPPHAGFGLGIERTVRWICGLPHIRDACLFPRTPDRIYP